jgi:coenzyme F420-reducing hydrogenase alpha subunit
MSAVRTIKVDYLARVEGEGAMLVKIKDGVVRDVKLKIFEPPRFFEAFLRGRDFREAPDITARICGICPVAYQMSSAQAMEAACGVKVDGPLRELRRLLYCGEWIESHVLHVFLLHAPDFLGYPSVVEMAKDHPGAVEKALRMKKLGNALMTLIGGREIHPINVKVGGFYRVPRRADLEALRGELEWAREEAVSFTAFVAKLDFPDLERDYEFVALRHPAEYAIYDGRIVSSRGLDVAVADYEKHFEEEHVEWAHALHSRRIPEGNAYFVGPLARYSLNFDRLSPIAQAAARDAGLGKTCRNPFRSIIVRLVETVWACDEALRILDAYEEPDRPAVEVTPRAGVGCGASEAPRGTLYHRYRIDGEGKIVDAKITPPTSQNQKTIEEDLRAFVEKRVDEETETLRWQCEQAIRNYDPCISCATHFLDLRVERE